MTRIIDSFMYAGEADMLYFRLEHLSGRVDRHVIAEATRTHQGVPRDLWVPKHLGCCLAPYCDRITFVQVDFPDVALGPWEREHYQRDQLWNGLASVPPDMLRPDDVVLIADVDEIPSDEALSWSLDERPHAAVLRQRTFHSAVDWEYTDPQYASVIVKAGLLSWPWGTLSKIRDARDSLPVIQDGGWHFSWLGSLEERRRKLRERTCHTTDVPAAELEAIDSGATWESGLHYPSVVKPVDVDDTWPPYISQRKCPATWFRPRT